MTAMGKFDSCLSICTDLLAKVNDGIASHEFLLKKLNDELAVSRVAMPKIFHPVIEFIQVLHLVGSDTINQLFNGTIFQHDCSLMLIDLKDIIINLKRECASEMHLPNDTKKVDHTKHNRHDPEFGQFQQGDLCAIHVLNLDRNMPEKVLKEGLLGLLSIYGIVVRVDLAFPFTGKEQLIFHDYFCDTMTHRSRDMSSACHIPPQ